MVIERKQIRDGRVVEDGSITLGTGPVQKNKDELWTIGNVDILPPYVRERLSTGEFGYEEPAVAGRLAVADQDTVSLEFVNPGMPLGFDQPVRLYEMQINMADLRTPPDSRGVSDTLVWTRKPLQRRVTGTASATPVSTQVR